MSTSTAYLLVSHGSHDPRPAQAMERLAQTVRLHLLQKQAPALPQRSLEKCLVPYRGRQSLGTTPLLFQTAEVQSQQLTLALERRQGKTSLGSDSPPDSPPKLLPEPLDKSDFSDWPLSVKPPLVGTACLEAGALPLHQQIIGFSRRAQAAGVETIRILPLFLLKGIHVTEDIPAEICLAQQAVPELTLALCPHLGSHPGLKALLQTKLHATTSESLLLLAHGSRKPGGNRPIHSLARALGGTAAFWAVAPNLETQIIELMQAGAQRLAILPYFLFAGRITDAITHVTEELAERFPSLGMHLLPPLGPSAELASLVTDLGLNRLPPKHSAPLPLQRKAFRHQVRSPLTF
ncbi:MAG: sirohydrochlorin chelatase [Leptolyngbyaceae cyanobacterium SM2_3_12]|nr:sirohydrochlorin chelatase [Leptolyngbyaceae cyanobacterium SM2_3_12]